MTANVVNQAPFLRTTRNFPVDSQALSVELNRSYLDIASKVNDRSIGIFPTSRPVITGDSYYLSNNQKQQSLRQIYPFVGPAPIASIPHGVTASMISSFSRCYGWFTDGTNWYGAFFASNVAIAGQVTFYINSTNIVFLVGAGAPTISSGTIVLEWLSLA